ncbi:MAG: hypothetical protein ACT4O1_14850 [Gemmatimonadota bacterium]
MNRRWFQRSAWAAVCLALVTVSCERSATAPNATAPASTILPSYSVGGVPFTPVREDATQLPTNPLDLVASATITPDGGTVELLGHSIHVPSGAVTSLTTFTIEIASLEHISVDLTATAVVPDLISGPNVGKRGFRKPVTLTLTYKRSPDAATLNPKKLHILHLQGSNAVPVGGRKVDPVAQTVSAKLQHFSKYCMAEN